MLSICGPGHLNNETLLLTKTDGLDNDYEWFTLCYSIECMNCGVKFSEDYIDNVIEKWNNREE